MLYNLSVSPYECDLPALLRLVTPDDAILLLQDGVTAAVQDSESLALLLKSNAFLCALKEDIIARGLIDKISSEIKVVDYNYFVKLTTEHHPCLTW